METILLKSAFICESPGVKCGDGDSYVDIICCFDQHILNEGCKKPLMKPGVLIGERSKIEKEIESLPYSSLYSVNISSLFQFRVWRIKNFHILLKKGFRSNSP